MFEDFLADPCWPENGKVLTGGPQRGADQGCLEFRPETPAIGSGSMYKEKVIWDLGVNGYTSARIHKKILTKLLSPWALASEDLAVFRLAFVGLRFSTF